jgi:hypothetical protein
MMDFNPAVRRTAAFGQLEEHADLAIELGKRWLFQRADSTYQADERHAAWIVWVRLRVLTDDEIANRRMHLAHPVTFELVHQTRQGKASGVRILVGAFFFIFHPKSS